MAVPGWWSQTLLPAVAMCPLWEYFSEYGGVSSDGGSGYMTAVQLTVGVEEEFLLLDAEKSHAAPAVDAVLAEVTDDLRGQVAREYLTSQIEINSPPGL